MTLRALLLAILLAPCGLSAWAETEVNGVLGHMDHFFSALDALTGIELTGDLGAVLKGIFADKKIPGSLQGPVMQALLDSGDRTMYGVMQALTSVANMPDLPSRHVDLLLAAGGSVPTSTHAMCGACHRSM